MKYLLVLVTLAVLACQQKNNGFEHIPKMLVIGDSVTKAYMPYLKDIYNVRYVENARTSEYTLAHLHEGINDSNYDIIIWNNGLHDAVYSDYNSYESNIIQIEAILKQHTNRLFFVSTTKTLNGYYNTIVNDLNNIANNVLQVNIINLNEFTQSLDQSSWVDNEHFNDETSKAFADLIKQAIKGVIHDNSSKISL